MSAQNTMSVWEFLQSLNLADGGRIERTALSDLFTMVLEDGKPMYFVGLQFCYSDTEVSRTLVEAVVKIRDYVREFAGILSAYGVPFVILQDDTVIAVEIDVGDVESKILEKVDDKFPLSLKDGDREKNTAKITRYLKGCYRAQREESEGEETEDEETEVVDIEEETEDEDEGTKAEQDHARVLDY